jgi:hypothetical protein
VGASAGQEVDSRWEVDAGQQNFSTTFTTTSRPLPLRPDLAYHRTQSLSPPPGLARRRLHQTLPLPPDLATALYLPSPNLATTFSRPYRYPLQTLLATTRPCDHLQTLSLPLGLTATSRPYRYLHTLPRPNRLQGNPHPALTVDALMADTLMADTLMAHSFDGTRF